MVTGHSFMRAGLASGCSGGSFIDTSHFNNNLSFSPDRKGMFVNSDLSSVDPSTVSISHSLAVSVLLLSPSLSPILVCCSSPSLILSPSLPLSLSLSQESLWSRCDMSCAKWAVYKMEITIFNIKSKSEISSVPIK